MTCSKKSKSKTDDEDKRRNSFVSSRNQQVARRGCGAYIAPHLLRRDACTEALRVVFAEVRMILEATTSRAVKGGVYNMMVRFMVDSSIQGHALVQRSGANLPSDPLQMSYGNRRVRIDWRREGSIPSARFGENASRCTDATVAIGPKLQSTLRMPSQATLHTRFKGGVLQAGPCLGLYVTKDGTEGRMFGEQSRMLEDITRLGDSNGVDVVILTPGFAKQQVGWRFVMRDESWESIHAPLPDIVVRRSGRFVESDAVVNADLSMFMRTGRLHSLPRISSNKWTFYQTVRQNAVIRSHLPNTRQVTSAQELENAVRQLGDVYLKPINGAQGICICRLQRIGSTRFRMTNEERVVPRSQDRLSEHFRPQTRVVQSVVSTGTEVLQLWNKLQSSYKKWIVQESVDLIQSLDKRPVDFRWLLQDSDRPQVTGRVARRGAPGSVTTNLHTGGAALDACDVLTELQLKDVHQLIEQIDALSIEVVKHLRSEFGPFAEVGVDIGIDKSGHVYVFEVNPTPGRRMLRSLSGNPRELSLIRLIEYAIRASGFEEGKSV